MNHVKYLYSIEYAARVEATKARNAVNFARYKRDLSRPRTPKGATAKYLQLLQQECQRDHDEDRNGDFR